MIGYLIDPYDTYLKAVDYDLRTRKIHDIIECSADGLASMGLNHDVLHFNARGHQREDKRLFIIAGWAKPIAGKALLLGVDGEGFRAPKLEFRQLWGMVEFGSMTNDPNAGNLVWKGRSARAIKADRANPLIG